MKRGSVRFCFQKGGLVREGDLIERGVLQRIYSLPLSVADLTWSIGEGHFRSKGRGWQKIFPNVHILLKILTTLPVITAENERLFFKLNNTLSAIRSTMTEERLESLLLIQVHRDKTPSIERIIESFASLKSRRLTLTL